MRYKFFFAAVFLSVSIISCVKQNADKSEDIKIFALSPSLAETVFFLGKGGYLKGVSSSCEFPEGVKSIPAVANVSDINLEMTLRINPDIVFIMPSQTHIGLQLDKLNINSVTVSQESLDDILQSFRIVGSHTGASERANAVYDSLRFVLKSYESAPSGKTVLISAGREFGSSVSYIYSVGTSGFLNDIFNLLGYENALNTSIPYPKIGAESIMTLNPDIIVDLVPGSVFQDESDFLKDWSAYSGIKAHRNNKIYIFKGDHTTIPGPRIFDFLKELKENGF